MTAVLLCDQTGRRREENAVGRFPAGRSVCGRERSPSPQESVHLLEVIEWMRAGARAVEAIHLGGVETPPRRGEAATTSGEHVHQMSGSCWSGCDGPRRAPHAVQGGRFLGSRRPTEQNPRSPAPGRFDVQVHS